MNNTKKFENLNVEVRFSYEWEKLDCISMKNKLDFYNEESIFTKTKRNLWKVYNKLRSLDWQVLSTITFRDVCDMLDEVGIRYHYYCAID